MAEPVVVNMGPSGSAAPPAPVAAAPVSPPPELPVLPEPPPPPVAAPGRTAAGVGLLSLAAGAGAGLLLGGLWGGLAGALYTGAARNTWRAARTWSDPDAEVRNEAVRSATVAVFGAFLAVVATVQAATKTPQEKVQEEKP